MVLTCGAMPQAVQPAALQSTTVISRPFGSLSALEGLGPVSDPYADVLVAAGPRPPATVGATTQPGRHTPSSRNVPGAWRRHPWACRATRRVAKARHAARGQQRWRTGLSAGDLHPGRRPVCPGHGEPYDLRGHLLGREASPWCMWRPSRTTTPASLRTPSRRLRPRPPTSSPRWRVRSGRGGVGSRVA